MVAPVAQSFQQKLEETFGQGGFQAARGHGGITARIERGGIIRMGDSVRVLPSDPSFTEGT